MKMTMTLAVAVLLPVAAAAQAQQILTSPGEIAACLCAWERVEARQTELNIKRNELERTQRLITELDAQVAVDRTRVDAKDPAGMQAFTDLLKRADAMRDRYNAEIAPAYNEAVARYNGAAGAYSQQCGGKSFDATVHAAVRQTLNCPRE